MEELTRAEGILPMTQEWRFFCTTLTYLLLCILDKDVDIEYEGDLTDFSIESNLASPLEEKSWVLLDTSL